MLTISVNDMALMLARGAHIYHAEQASMHINDVINSLAESRAEYALAPSVDAFAGALIKRLAPFTEDAPDVHALLSTTQEGAAIYSRLLDALAKEAE